MQKQPTIRDVAQAAGVSVAVVSRVLNPGSGPVAAATRSRVNDVMKNLGYHPRTAARELKYGPPTTLGLLLADVSNPFSPDSPTRWCRKRTPAESRCC